MLKGFGRTPFGPRGAGNSGTGIALADGPSSATIRRSPRRPMNRSRPRLATTGPAAPQARRGQRARPCCRPSTKRSNATFTCGWSIDWT